MTPPAGSVPSRPASSDDAWQAPRGWVQPGEVLLHLGLPKTGTTSLQFALHHAHQQLAAAGVVRPTGAPSQFLAVNHVVRYPVRAAWGVDEPWLEADRGPGSDPTGIGLWTRLVRELAQRGTSRAVVSAENMAHADDAAVHRLTTDIGPARALLVVRPLETLLPSMWQQHVREGFGTSLPDWLDIVLNDRGSDDGGGVGSTGVGGGGVGSGGDGAGAGGMLGWPGAFDVPGIVDRWVRHLGADRVAVLVQPPTDRGLFDAVETLLDLPARTLRPERGTTRNRSLTAAEAEVLRRAVAVVDRSAVGAHDYFWSIYVALLGMAAERTPLPGEPRIALPAWAVHECRRVGRQHVDHLADAASRGVLVVGDVQALVPTTPVEEPDTTLSLDQVADAAAHLAAQLMKLSATHARRVGAAAGAPQGAARWVPPALLPAARRARRSLTRRRR